MAESDSGPVPAFKGPFAWTAANAAEAGEIIARYVDKNYAPGFYKDYAFSRQPLYARMAATKQIKRSCSGRIRRNILPRTRRGAS